MFPRATYKEKEDWENIPDPVGSLKRDGSNFFQVIDSEGKSRFFSRRPSVKGGFPERTSQLPHLTSKLLPQFANNVLNVELVHTGHSSLGKDNHPGVSGILNSLPEKSIETQKQTGPVRAIMLNVIHPVLPTYAAKLDHMKKVEEAFGQPELLKSIEVKIGKRQIQDLIDSTKKLGQEGAIITSLTAPEASNPRIKVKHFNTWNLRVSGITQEYDTSGKPKESAGGLKVVDATGREVAVVGTGLSKEQRKHIWENPDEYINKEIQVKGRMPSRSRIIAPVFHGSSDGEIDTVSMNMNKQASDLEDKLIETLVTRYGKAGVNLQAILDNQLFQQLPLDKKVAFIEQMKSPISQKPSLSLQPVIGDIFSGRGALGGAIPGGIAGAISVIMAARTGFNPKAILAGAGAGAAIGSVVGAGAGLLESFLNKRRDINTHAIATTYGGLDTLINRSTSQYSGGSNKFVNRILGSAEPQASKLGDFIAKKYGY